MILDYFKKKKKNMRRWMETNKTNVTECILMMFTISKNSLKVEKKNFYRIYLLKSHFKESNEDVCMYACAVHSFLIYFLYPYLSLSVNFDRTHYFTIRNSNISNIRDRNLPRKLHFVLTLWQKGIKRPNNNFWCT